MDGKRRVLIIDFLNCTQVLSRKQHGKAGRIQDSEKRWYSALPSKWWSELRKQNPDFLCFILDATRIQLREIAIEMLFFPFISKKLCFAFNVVKNLPIHPSYQGRSSKYGGRSNR